ncbi:hypothetical protein [Sphingosinicella sp. BN140058]|uniref:hypothetical protein n=1 Tax=Sphingosinicella sp. BN140058 TaxID=1892855 RepID=UPI001012D43A|nr:hypothetical protein [Sphingosinicella sp. BN140058]QAY80161.1 hypothetical protein ETR14_26320 [Sphingosinicella sp. BN140058]
MKDRFTGWKAGALQLHRWLTGPSSNAEARFGHWPYFAQSAFEAASAAAGIAGKAKKLWRDGNANALTVKDIQEARNQINLALGMLEMLVAQDDLATSAITSDNAAEADATYASHGNFGLLALGHLEEAGELAEHLAAVAAGRVSLANALPSIGAEAADVRMYHQVTCEQALIPTEASTAAKWAIVQSRFPEAAFKLQQSTGTADHVAAMAALISQETTPKPKRKAA